MSKLIPLTKDKFATVDDEDFELVSQFKWSAHKSNGGWYAYRRFTDSEGNLMGQFMHRLIMQTPPHLKTDHRDLDTLNNRRDNLRNCTNLDNCANQRRCKSNTSGFRGVYFFKRTSNWKAHIKRNYQNYHLGTFQTKEAAARAYDAAAKLHHGEFARLNFPENI